MHAVLALKESGKRGLREVVLHLEQVDQLRLATAPLNHFVQILLWLLDELVDTHFICEYAIFLCVLEDTEIGFTWHKQAILLNNVDETEAKEVERDVHEIWCTVGHQTNNVGV